MVITVRIDGNPRYSWTKNQRSWFVSRTRPRSFRRKNNHLMSERGILSLQPDLRLEWRGQDRQDETQELNHSAS